MSDATMTRPARGAASGSHERGHVLPLLELAAIAGLASIIAIHATELSSKVDEVAYLGAGYVVLIAGAFLAIVMLAVGDKRGWVLTGATAGATLVGFILTRTTGLPGSTGDVGNWGETLAVWSMISEVGVCLLVLAAIRRDRRELRRQHQA